MENIKITVGSPNFGKGQTTVIVSPNGLMEVSNTLAKDTSSCRIETDPEDVKGILSSLQNRIRPSKRRKGVPDEVEYAIEITVPGGKTLHYLVWDNDISKDQELKMAFRQLREIILKNTEQKILL